MKKNSRTKTIHAKELEEYLSNVLLDVPIYVQCSFNRYKIKSLLDCNQFIVLEVGETDNEE